MNAFILFFTLLLDKLQYPSIMLFIFRLSQSIQFQWINSLFFGLFDHKVHILQFDFLFLPSVQNWLFNVHFSLFFQSLSLGFSLLTRVRHRKWSLKKLNAFLIVFNLLLFFEIFKVLSELFRGSNVFISFCLFYLFVIFSNCLFHEVKLRKLIRLFVLVCRKLDEAVKLIKLVIFHESAIFDIGWILK